MTQARPSRSVPVLTKEGDQMFTVLVVDPIAIPVARHLAGYAIVTPNRITVAAGLVGAGSATCFVLGNLRLAGVLFLLRFFLDCLDGKIARARGTSSARGGALDLMVDVAGILACYGAAASYLGGSGELPLGLAVALLALVALYNWALQYRKQLAAALGEGDGGMAAAPTSDLPLVGRWFRWSERRGMSPIPYAVEVEVLCLGFLPLLAPLPVVALGLWVAALFYLLAAAVNLRRVWRVAGALDATTAPLAAPPPASAVGPTADSGTTPDRPATTPQEIR